ncbi:cyclin-dependent kinase inhibitor 1C-like [Palaemon carinicauda]|uniref:cyclin-dependent kinase inhibitor 1C-like n=1 Tax=Palaemon carinicauda TaxID=392227 RepID=UPI0035B69E5F
MKGVVTEMEMCRYIRITGSSSRHHKVSSSPLQPDVGTTLIMKTFILLMAAVACHASVLPYSVVPSAPAILHADSLSPPVMKIPKPGIRFNVPAPATYSRQVVVPAPAPFIPAAPAPAPVVSYSAPVIAAAPAPAPVVSYSAPVSAPVPAIPAAPVAIAAAPEPLEAPEPPMPSIGEPFVGGQFHAQDEAGQYSFGHWGGPNTRVETRDYLGRTAGSFAYIDPVGDVQVRKYAAAPASGFKVAASDLP